ncbi:MAG: hypothetical protein COB30_017300 [Ectothiorhodospiraceae bacterium]|nr:hypothetical protein [Ectothiorhodospiraceae bacterium]
MSDHNLFPTLRHTALRSAATALIVGASIFSAGCSDTGDTSSLPAGSNLLTLSMPDSLTGGTTSTSTAASVRNRAARSVSISKSESATKSSDEFAELCFHNGVEDEDVFRNGYRMSKFMVAVIATWTCLADTIIDLAAVIPNDGQIKEGENDTTADNYEADEPTHYSVTSTSATQTTVRLYYGYDRAVPPTIGDDASFFFPGTKQKMVM